MIELVYGSRKCFLKCTFFMPFLQRVKCRLYENVRVVKQRAALHDPELQAFHTMVKKLRGKCVV
jgi:hypothetical protein